MSMINETINLNPKSEGLVIDIARIAWDEAAKPVGGLKTWMTVNFPADEIAAGLGIQQQNGWLTFTEDDFEAFLGKWLTEKFAPQKGFRWMWDKYRNYKAD